MENNSQARAQADVAAQQLKIASNDLPLLKDVAWHEFKDALETIAHMLNPIWILNLAEPLPEELTAKQEADLRNAYSLYKNKTRGHPVENKLAGVSVGDARGAWKRINLYFVKGTPIGKGNLINRFWQSTMQLLNGRPWWSATPGTSPKLAVLPRRTTRPQST